MACIYGACSRRCAEAKRAASLKAGADILVATDAIGMGLNLPIQRVVFTAIQRYDGALQDTLSPSLLQLDRRTGGALRASGGGGCGGGLTPAEHAMVSLMKARNPPGDQGLFRSRPAAPA